MKKAPGEERRPPHPSGLLAPGSPSVHRAASQLAAIVGVTTGPRMPERCTRAAQRGIVNMTPAIAPGRDSIPTCNATYRPARWNMTRCEQATA